jgi:hypothetical protein
MNVLINHPSVGSVWLMRAEIKDEYVTGEVLDTSECGSPYLPIDYPGQYETMWFPITCIRKKEE